MVFRGHFTKYHNHPFLFPNYGNSLWKLAVGHCGVGIFYFCGYTMPMAFRGHFTKYLENSGKKLQKNSQIGGVFKQAFTFY